MDGDPPSRPSGWERQEARCPECGFDWDEASYEVLVGQCVTNIAVFGGVLSRIDPAEAVEPGLWSASRYVWHTVDVLRFGTERLWTISADPAFGVPAWDENIVAEVRSYDELSPIVGLIALLSAADGVAHGSVRSTARRDDTAPRVRRDLCLRCRPTKCPRGLPPPVGRPTGDGRLTREHRATGRRHHGSLNPARMEPWERRATEEPATEAASPSRLSPRRMREGASTAGAASQPWAQSAPESPGACTPSSLLAPTRW